MGVPVSFPVQKYLYAGIVPLATVLLAVYSEWAYRTVYFPAPRRWLKESTRLALTISGVTSLVFVCLHYGSAMLAGPAYPRGDVLSRLVGSAGLLSPVLMTTLALMLFHGDASLGRTIFGMVAAIGLPILAFYDAVGPSISGMARIPTTAGLAIWVAVVCTLVVVARNWMTKSPRLYTSEPHVSPKRLWNSPILLVAAMLAFGAYGALSTRRCRLPWAEANRRE